LLKTSDVMAFVLQMNAGPALSRTIWEVWNYVPAQRFI
jgi:hypothetical protein